VFLGTPHRGSNHASLVEIIRHIVCVVGFDMWGQIIQALQPDGDIIELAHEEFCELRHEGDFVVQTFQYLECRA
jgi:hypothetical protein